MISRIAYLNELLHQYLSNDPEQGLEIWSSLFDQYLQVWNINGCYHLLHEIRRLDLSTEIGDVAYMLSKTSQGMLAAVVGDWEKAIRIYEGLLPITPEKNLGWILSNLANFYYLANDLNNAVITYSKALEEYKKLKNLTGQAKVLVNLGSMYRDIGDNPKAIQNLEMASQIIPEDDIETRVLTLVNWASALQISGNMALAEEKYQQALQYLDKFQAPHLKAQVLGNMGILYIAKEKPVEAIEYFLEDLTLHQELEDLVAQAETLNNLGLAYSQPEEMDKALHCYMQSAEIKKALGILRENSRLGAIISSLLLIMGSPSRLKYFLGPNNWQLIRVM